MFFKITGLVREKESFSGISNVIVSAFDKDLLFDDLLGQAVTDESGHFQLDY